MPRKALGMGLSALVPLSPTPQTPSSVLPSGIQGSEALAIKTANPDPIEIDLARIVPNRYQPRQTFNPENLNQLAQSIKSHGLMQPIVVRPVRDLPGASFELIAGERRMRASALAGLSKIPAVIRPLGNHEMMEYALIENLQREDLNPVEKARAYSRLVSEFACTQEEVAEKVGIDRSSVTNTLRLLNLPDVLQSDIAEGTISMGHAKILLGLESPALQRRIAEQIKAKGLSVRQLTLLVQNKKTSAPSPKTAKRRQAPEVAALERRLLQALGTKVELVPASQGTGGEIKITYYSLDDLDRILEIVEGRTS